MQRFVLATACLGLALLTGCGSNDGMTEVSGQVTMDGQPVPQGAINFIPVDGNAPTAGALIANGHYATRVPVGEMKVEVSIPKVVGTKKIYDTPDSPSMPVTEEAAPEKYNKKTELKLAVQPGKNEKNWPLTSK